jgi:hypothetical protein
MKKIEKRLKEVKKKPKKAVIYRLSAGCPARKAANRRPTAARPQRRPGKSV